MDRLKEWTCIYVKNKDLLQRKLQNQTEKGNTLTFHYKDKIHEYVIQEQLSNCFQHKTSTPSLTFVCPATPLNLDYILKNWRQLITCPFQFIFVNLKNNDKWILNPSTHHLIADESTLELGLKSMFANVAGLPLPPEPKHRRKDKKDEEPEESEEE
ncbi:MAG TPA: hypothetical protein VJG90_04655 [Candidatus Nanoarchaeia archaeon]|nr:hypothetical protein [Candidatus Nanoarchaeia archaeon]